MKDDIVRKLRLQLSESVNTECQVVYVLCEIRKLLEKYPPDPVPFALRFYCHWALHIDLTQPKTTMPFLRLMDSFIVKSWDGQGGGVSEQEHNSFRELVYLDTFKKELSQFLRSHSLPTSLCDDERRWFAFLQAYAGVIEDGSLTCGGNTSDLQRIKKVVFKKGSATSENSPVPFTINWTISLHSGQELELEPDSNWNLVGSKIRVTKVVPEFKKKLI